VAETTPAPPARLLWCYVVGGHVLASDRLGRGDVVLYTAREGDDRWKPAPPPAGALKAREDRS
jgi:hypothetical protein